MTRLVDAPEFGPVLAAFPVLFQGILLGLGAAVPIGPVNVEIARRTIRHGFGAGAALGFGAVTVDVAYAVVASLGAKPLLSSGVLYWPLLIGGVGLLVYLGVSCWVAALRAWRSDPLTAAGMETGAAPPARPRAGAHYLTGLLMTLLNPMTLAFWFVVVPAAVAPATTGRGGRDLPMICAGVFIGTVAWVATFAGLMTLAVHRGLRPGAAGADERLAARRRAWLAAADGVGGTVLLGFAAATLLRSVR